MDYKLLETVADIAYYAGEKRFFSGDSRADVSDFIWWAKEFEQENLDTNWDCIDYIETLQKFIKIKMKNK